MLNKSKFRFLSLSLFLFSACTFFQPKQPETSPPAEKKNILFYRSQGKVLWQAEEEYKASFKVRIRPDFFSLGISHIISGGIFYLEMNEKEIFYIDYKKNQKQTIENTPRNRRNLTGFDLNYPTLRSIFLGYVPENDDYYFSGEGFKPDKIEIFGVSSNIEVVFEEWKFSGGFEFPSKFVISSSNGQKNESKVTFYVTDLSIGEKASELSKR